MDKKWINRGYFMASGYIFNKKFFLFFIANPFLMFFLKIIGAQNQLPIPFVQF